MKSEFLNGKIVLYAGDMLEILAGSENPLIPDASIDSVVTDPPYHLASIVKRFGADAAAPAKSDGPTGIYERSSRGFMGKRWDGGGIAFDDRTWARVLRVLKPGGHLFAFAHPKNEHRMTCAIEDAGFEIRDKFQWMFATGFPKSHRIAFDFERTLCKRWPGGWRYVDDDTPMAREPPFRHPLANEWAAWGTAVKPAYEPIVMARKPLIGTVAENVEAHGTGALNIDACRIGMEGGTKRAEQAPYPKNADGTEDRSQHWARTGHSIVDLPVGRWPANIAHDGSEEVLAAFPETTSGELLPHHRKSGRGLSGTSTFAIRDRTGEPAAVYGDAGSAARFFFSGKADQDERLGSGHPTVKPVDLIRWLCRMITPPGGTILDPFAGTGTTAEAAIYEGFKAILIEREAEYVKDITRRAELILAGPDQRNVEKVKAKMKDKLIDNGPLFGGKE